jgi:phosphoglycerol transferase MdoB-like AlkP superfamily enzyme
MKKIINRFTVNAFVLSLCMFSTEMYVRFLMKSSFIDFATLRIAISSLIVGLVVSWIGHYLPRVGQRILNSIFVIFIGIEYLVEFSLYNFIGFFMGISNASQGTKAAGYIRDLLTNNKPSFYFILVIMILFLIYYIFIDRKLFKDNHKHQNIKNDIIRNILFIILIIGLSGFYYYTIRSDKFQNKLQTTSNYSLWLFPENSNLSVNNYGIFMYVFSDIKSVVTGIDSDYVMALEASEESEEKVDKEDAVVTDNTRVIDDTAWESLNDETTDTTYKTLNSYYMNRDITDKNDMTGIFEGKNLIVILMESVDEIAILNEKDFPTLYKMYHQGISFTNNFTPRNNCSTGNNEFTVLTSLFTINNTCTANAYATKYNFYESAYGIFDDAGYQTSGYHDYSDYFYYRSSIHPNLGAYAFYGAQKLGIAIDTSTNDEDMHNEWPSDVDLFKTAKSHYMDDDKFMAYFATVTTHQTYYDSSTWGDAYTDEWANTDYPEALKRYLSKMKVLDNALAELQSELQAEGKLDDTVIALFGDHFPYGLTDDQINVYLSENGAGYTVDRNSTTNKNVDRTPMIIYNSTLKEPIKVTSYTTVIDLLPTLLNMFNMNYDPRLYLGTDVFSNSYVSRAVFSDASWQNEYGFYYAPTSKMTYVDGSTKTYTDAELVAINKEINTRQSMSGSSIKSGYFEYLMDGLDKYKSLTTTTTTIATTLEPTTMSPGE